MKNSNENKLSMYQKVRAFMDVNADTIAPSLPAITTEKEKFYELLSELELHLTEAGQDNTAYAAQKQFYRENLRQKMFELTGALRVFLTVEGNDKIAAQKVDITKSDIDRKRDNELQQLYDTIKPIATTYADDLFPYGFNSTRLTEITTAYNFYRSYIGQPGDERSQSAAALLMSEKFFGLVDDQLEMIDSLMQTVSVLHEALYLQYTFDRMIDDTGSNTPTPPDYAVTIDAGATVLVAELPYLANRLFKAKNLSADDVQWSLSTVNNAFSTPPHTVPANSISNKRSDTLASNGNFLVFQNLSANSVEIEVTVF